MLLLTFNISFASARSNHLSPKTALVLRSSLQMGEFRSSLFFRAAHNLVRSGIVVRFGHDVRDQGLGAQDAVLCFRQIELHDPIIDLRCRGAYFLRQWGSDDAADLVAELLCLFLQ
ncbi:hypothetical protein [Xanthomonas sp. GW]|uniref:hypothetical protein n=1 Tax=Xanthomonas sp. GW TaxID=2724121 RepID=UPI00163AB780|nr:hypothetical protein [Xanthomonas sp. GW]